MADNYEYVDHPAHYNKPGQKETIEKMVDKWGAEATALWCEITAFKYQDRMGAKPGESIEREQGKIDWYLNKAAELRGRVETDSERVVAAEQMGFLTRR